MPTPTVARDFPAIGAAASGDFVVTWRDTGQDGSNSGIFARRFSSAGAAQGAEFQVSTRTVGYEAFPMVGIGTDGDFVVAWQSYAQDDPLYGVFARSFSSAGIPLANDFQVNTYTNGSQVFPQVGAAASGNFVVAWHSPQDGSDAGIFAQRFASPKDLDIDGDGAILPLTDGLLVLRSTFGFTGAVLTNGAVNLVGCTRCDAVTIEAYLKTLN